MPITSSLQQKERWEYIKALRINDFCKAYGIGRSTAYDLINSGKLRSVMIGGRRVIPVEEAEKLLLPQN
jgi:excisionase family DNA binding protein